MGDAVEIGQEACEGSEQWQSTSGPWDPVKKAGDRWLCQFLWYYVVGEEERRNGLVRRGMVLHTSRQRGLIAAEQERQPGAVRIVKPWLLCWRLISDTCRVNCSRPVSPISSSRFCPLTMFLSQASPNTNHIIISNQGMGKLAE